MKKHLLLILLIILSAIFFGIASLTYSVSEFNKGIETGGIFESPPIFQIAVFCINTILVMSLPLLLINYLYFSKKRIKRVFQSLVWIPVYIFPLGLFLDDIFWENGYIINKIEDVQKFIFFNFYGVIIIFLYYLAQYFINEKTNLKKFISKKEVKFSFIFYFSTVAILNILKVLFSDGYLA